MIKKIRNAVRTLYDVAGGIRSLHQRVSRLQEAVGRVEARQIAGLGITDLASSEFQCYSQGGADGAIAALTRHVPKNLRTFVEFGVEDYQEANTRFLLRSQGWRGLVMDGSEDNILRIRSEPDFWKFGLTATKAFITRDNINSLIGENGFSGDVGLVSIDIDGNDYWVWKELTVVKPLVVIIEYNHRLGPDRAVSIPYGASFARSQAHHSMIYFGASLAALIELGKSKGYSFVGCSSQGNDAYFLRKDFQPPEFRTLSASEGFVAGLHRETRDEFGHFAYLSPEREREILAKLPFVEVSP